MNTKTLKKVTSGLLILCVSGWLLTAQDSGRANDPEQRPNAGPGGPGGPRWHRLPPSPLFTALDVNHDGVIDETEIANASAALRTLDKNGDGKITMDELMPPRPLRGEWRDLPPEPPGPPPSGAENEQQPSEAR